MTMKISCVLYNEMVNKTDTRTEAVDMFHTRVLLQFSANLWCPLLDATAIFFLPGNEIYQYSNSLFGFRS